MIWINKKDELPLSGMMILAKKSELDEPELINSDWLRHHLSQYNYWKYNGANTGNNRRA